MMANGRKHVICNNIVPKAIIEMDYLEDINAAIYRYVVDYAYYSVGTIDVHAECGHAEVERIQIRTNTFTTIVTRDEEFCIALADGITGISHEEMDFIFDLKKWNRTIFDIADRAYRKFSEA